MHFYKTPASLLVAFSVMFTATGCQRGWDETGGISEDYTHFYGPGSRWDLKLDNDNTETEEVENNFLFTRQDTHDGDIKVTIKGSFERLDSGFTELTISNPSGDMNETVTVIELSSNYAFVLPVYKDSSQLIAMVKADDCPNPDESTANYIRFKNPTTAQDTATDPMDFGVFVYSEPETQIKITKRYQLDDPTPETAAEEFVLDSSSCSEGYAHSSKGTHYLTNFRGAILDLFNDSTAEQQFLFGLDVRAISAVTDFNTTTNYIGTIFDGGKGETYPIVGKCDAGVCNIDEITDVADQESASGSNANIVLTLNGEINVPTSGFILGTLSFDDGTTSETVACMYESSPKRILACTGKSSNNNTKPVNVFMTLK